MSRILSSLFGAKWPLWVSLFMLLVVLTWGSHQRLRAAQTATGKSANAAGAIDFYAL